jgi:hypothetical protein
MTVAGTRGFEVKDLFGSIRDVFGGGNGPDQSLVSSYISCRMGQRSHIFSLKPTEKPFQLNVRCYRSEDIRGVPDKDKFQKAYATMTLHLHKNSHLHLMVTGVEEMISQGAQYWGKSE